MTVPPQNFKSENSFENQKINSAKTFATALEKKPLHKKSNFFRFVAFVVPLFFLLGLCSKILVPKKPENIESKMLEYRSLKKSGVDVQVITLGSSHMEIGFSPIDFYKNSKVVSYNLASMGSPFVLSYFMLKEALKTQKPKVIVFDAGMFFKGHENSGSYNTVIDDYPFGRSKVSIAHRLAKIESEKDFNGIFWGAFFPLWKYHSRWKNLNFDYFKPVSGKNNERFAMGFWTVPCVIGSSENSETINNFAAASKGYNSTYTLDFEKDFEEYFDAAKFLCRQNGIELLVVKIPTNWNPISTIGSRAWTYEKYEKTKKFCEEHETRFVDFQYDLNVPMDWRYETYDGGVHVNTLGAKKVTKALGDYLVQNYDLAQTECARYEYCAKVYDKVSYASDLELTLTLPEYARLLRSSHKDTTVFLACMEDAICGITQEEKDALAQLGLKATFDSSLFVNSYVAVIKNGVVDYESFQKKRQQRKFTLNDGREVSVLSSGWYSESAVSIKIDGQEQCLPHKGLHIVVVDNKSGIVLDSVCFDTNDPNNFNAIRNNGKILGYYQAYRAYVMNCEVRDARF